MINHGVKLEADPAMMHGFLQHLYGDQLDGRVELAWTDADDRKLRHARTFGSDEFDDLVEEAIRRNDVPGQNVYIGAALRQPQTQPFGRCKDEDFYAATAFWADLDDKNAVKTVKDKYRGCPPTLAVWTGMKPFPRVQLWWRQETPCSDAGAVKNQNSALAAALSGDPTVVNPSRVMALPGSIKWPIKAGRVIEFVELQTFDDRRPRVYIPGQIAKAFPPAEITPKTDLDIDFGFGVDPLDMLRAAKPGNWHNAMRAFTSHCVGAGYPDWLVVEAGRQTLDNSYDPSDLV